MGIIVAACVSQFHDSEGVFELLLAYNDGREIGHAMTRSAARQIADETSNAIGDSPLACQAAALQRENAELRAVMKECHAVLKMMISPGDISGSTVLGAFAAAKSAEARVRTLLGGENAGN